MAYRGFMPRTSLPVLGEQFFGMADTMAHERLSRDMTMTDVTQKHNPGPIETIYDPAGDMDVLSPLAVLKTIRDFSSYRGEMFNISRNNVQLVARLAGSSALGIYDLIPVTGFPDEEMFGIGQSFMMVRDKMRTTFRHSREPVSRDVIAWDMLIAIGRTINGA